MKYDLKDLVIFIHVAQLKSFVKTSQVLKISKTVVSSRIISLEKTLKINLLARTTRSVNLTGDGIIFYDYCQSIIEKVDSLDDFMQTYREINGTLKIALPPYFSRYYIVPHLEEFCAKYPELKLDIYATENPVDIITESYDLQVRIQIPEEETLQVTKLMENKKVLCASKEYLTKHQKPKNLEDLKDHNCIIFGENNIWNFRNKKSGKITRISDMKGNIKCNNGEMIKELILNGNGITIKSMVDIQDEIKNGKIITLLNEYDIINKTQFYATYPKARYTSPRVKAFIDFFQEKLKNSSWTC